MMAKKLCLSFLAAALLCSAAAPSWGDIQLGDFEAGLDGWEATASSLLTPTNFDAGIHVTKGSQSLNVFAPAGGGFQWFMQLDNNDIPNLAQRFINNNAKIYADVSWKTSEWTTPPSDGEWARWDTVSINSDLGWIQTADAQMTDAANPAFPGSWDPVNFGADHLRTVAWDFSSLIAGNEAAIAASSFFQINMSINFHSAFDEAAGYSFWIDNIRMLPEPSTLVLLGLSSVFVLTGRRRL